MKSIVIKQDEKKPIPAEIIAGSIIKISKSMKELSETRLARNTIVTLIHANSKVSKKHIELVLNNLEAMEVIWLKPSKEKK